MDMPDTGSRTPECGDIVPTRSVLLQLNGQVNAFSRVIALSSPVGKQKLYYIKNI
jgi:hypothetical protein